MTGLAISGLVVPSVAAQSTDDILVTAQLRPQSAFEVPIALSVFDGATLSRLALDQFSEFSAFVPGFRVQDQSPNNPGFVMRGITSDSGAAFTEPRVSVFQDGVSISKSRGSYVELFDLERIEVAKGPQSTLFGRGALIGAVNLIQNKADPEQFSASGRAEIGNHDLRIAEAILNVPLSPSTAIRIAGRVRRHDGPIDNLLGGKDFHANDTKAVRAVVHASTERLTVDLIGNYQHDRNSGTAFKSLFYRPTNAASGAVLGSLGLRTGAALEAGSGFEQGRALGVNREVWGISATGRFELSGEASLTAISGYRQFSGTEILDVDGTALPIFTAGEDARGRQFSQELRFTFVKGPLALTVGGSYFHEKGRQRSPVQFDERMVLATLVGKLSGPSAGRPTTDPAPAAIFGNTAFTAALLQGLAASQAVLLTTGLAQAVAANLRGDHRETTTNFARTNAFDLFGDMTLKMSPSLELGASLRYNHDRKSTGYSAAILNGRAVLGGVIAALSQPPVLRSLLLAGLATPGAATRAFSPSFPLPLFGLAIQPTMTNGNIITGKLNDDGLVGRATLRYVPFAQYSFYMSYARGRRPSVLSVSSPLAPNALPQFERLPAEVVDSYELGVKARTNDQRLSIDGAFYLYRYRNFQTLEQRGTQFINSTAGDARSYGFEGQLSWAPNHVLRITASYAYSHARFENGALKGNRLRLSPDHQAALETSFNLPLGEGEFSFTPNITYQSNVYFDDDNDRSTLQQPPTTLVPDRIRDEIQRGYLLVNGGVSYANSNGGWRITAFVKNLFDKRYAKDAGNTGDVLGLATAVAGMPRVIGLGIIIRL